MALSPRLKISLAFATLKNLGLLMAGIPSRGGPPLRIFSMGMSGEYILNPFMVFALMLGILAKRSGFAIGLLLLYYYIIEQYLNYKLPDDWGDFLPLRAVSNLIDIPNTSLMKLFGLNFREFVGIQDLLVVIAYTALFIYLMFLTLRKRDL